MSGTSNVKYLSSSEQDTRWGLTVNTAGHQLIKPNSVYPSASHPFHYLFSPEKGRILNEYQLIYILDGKGTFVSMNKKKMQIHSGHMILLFPGEWHSYKPDKETGWYEYWIGFNGQDIEKLVEVDFFRKDNPIFNIGLNENVIQLYKQAANVAQEQTTGFQQILAGIVHLLLGYTYSEHKQNSFINMNVLDQINTAKHFVAENYKTEITPKDIATKINMSYSCFRKVFKQYTGFSPSRYKEELRLQTSKELLANTTMTSQEIAFEVGFDTPYYFCILFKKRTGYSPLEYRNLAQGKHISNDLRHN